MDDTLDFLAQMAGKEEAPDEEEKRCNRQTFGMCPNPVAYSIRTIYKDKKRSDSSLFYVCASCVRQYRKINLTSSDWEYVFHAL